MSTESEPDTALDHPAARTRQKSMSVSEWFADEGLIPALVPMAYREGDPIEQLTRLSDEIDALPDTAATFTVNTILDDDERFTRTFAASAHITTLFRLCGAFRVDDTSTGYRWCNPDYVHGSPFRDPRGSLSERIHFARQVAPLGRVTVGDVARRFGTTEDTISRQFQQAGFEWTRRRAAGLARLARTVETIVAWTDRTYADVCSVLGIEPQTHRYHRNDKLAADWSPPADPTTEYGFTGR
jgi:hypothetical protein